MNEQINERINVPELYKTQLHIIYNFVQLF